MNKNATICIVAASVRWPFSLLVAGSVGYWARGRTVAEMQARHAIELEAHELKMRKLVGDVRGAVLEMVGEDHPSRKGISDTFDLVANWD